MGFLRSRIALLGAMLKFIIILGLLLAFVLGCSRSPPAQGVATWNEIAAIADNWMLKNNAREGLIHTDLSGMPTDKARMVRVMVETWKGVSPEMNHVATEVMTLAEYEFREKEAEKKKPEFFRRNPFPATKWSVRPDKVIVYKFHRGPEKEARDVEFVVGAFQRDGQWFLSACYD